MSASGSAASEPSRRRGRPRKDDPQITERQVLLLARKAFAEKGYDGVSVRDLNKELGVSHNLLHRRFGSKYELWQATVDDAFAEFLAALDPVLDAIEPGSPLESFREFIVAFIEFSAAQPELWRMMMFEGSTGGPRFDYVWERYVRPFGRRMRAAAGRLTGAERFLELPQATTFFLLAHGATAAQSSRATAMRISNEDPTDPVVLRRHADVVADLLLGIDPLVRLRATPKPSRRRGRARRPTEEQ